VGAIPEYNFADIVQDHTISASFTQKQFTITSSAGDGGSISPLGEITVTEGKNQTFTISSNDGYQLLDVIIDDQSAGILEEYIFEDVRKNHKIHARFIQNYNITATASKNGSISPQGQVVVTEGTDQTFNIIADTGYNILDVIVDNTSIGNKDIYTFENIINNHTISASFTQKQFTITSSAGDGGSISPLGETVVVLRYHCK